MQRWMAWPLVIYLVTVVSTGSRVPAQECELAAVRLRCEYRVDPAGIDVMRPGLSWEIVAPRTGRGKQTAYHVLVATTPARLVAGRADLWDSGIVESDRTAHVAYDGAPPVSRTTCYWKVRVRDEAGRFSAWAGPARWSMGLLEPADWTAGWIGAPGPCPRRGGTRLGARSRPVDRADVPHHITLDLRSRQSIDGVRLMPACVWDAAKARWGDWCHLFPVRYRILVSDDPDFGTSREVFRTERDLPDPTRMPGDVLTNTQVRFPAVEARYLRIRVDRLRARGDGRFGLALSDVQVYSDGVLLSFGAPVTMTGACDDAAAGWAVKFLVDGLHSMRNVGHDARLVPAPMLRKRFRVEGEIRRATLYATALGTYRLWINGGAVGRRRFAPEWTDPDQVLQYQTYDVTAHLRAGDNAIGALLGDGWYRGHRGVFGGPLLLRIQLEIEHPGGARTVVTSDGSWRATRDGHVRAADIFVGETQDLTRRPRGWTRPGFDDRAWGAVTVARPDVPRLVAQPDEPVREVRELRPVRRTDLGEGRAVFDLGQNMVGWCRLRVRGARGAEIVVRHAERLLPSGGTPLHWPQEKAIRGRALYTANLTLAPQEDRYRLAGGGPEVLEPHFTYHGFRYVEVSGLGAKTTLEKLTGVVVSADLPRTGRFACSDRRLTRLVQNIVWTQRGNLTTGVPTDCPQRAERAGWLGDAQVFAETACFNFEVAALYAKWLRHLRFAQSSAGLYTYTVPSPRFPPLAGAGWGDAGVVLPWRLYVAYADRRVVEQHLASAVEFLDWVESRNPDGLWRCGLPTPGDWLNGASLCLIGSKGEHIQLPDWPDVPMATDHVLLSTACWARCTSLAARMARAVGRDAEAGRLEHRHRHITAAFRAAFLGEGGRVGGGAQADYGLALAFGLLPEKDRARGLERLVEAIARSGDRLSTGIITTPLVLQVLADHGRVNLAYRLILGRRPPSYGYMIDQGATTMWERWDGFVKGRGFQDPHMNSFNHPSLGAVGAWVYRNVVGLNPDPTRPGWKHFVVRPRPGGGLTWARGSYHSMHGRIEAGWRRGAGRFELTVIVPPNTTADVVLPTLDLESVESAGTSVRGVLVREGVKIGVASGTHTFRCAVATRAK